MTRLSVIAPISILQIFILLFDAFKSIKSVVLILLNIPFALIGARVGSGMAVSVNQHAFNRIVGAVLMLSGVALLFK